MIAHPLLLCASAPLREKTTQNGVVERLEFQFAQRRRGAEVVSA